MTADEQLFLKHQAAIVAHDLNAWISFSIINILFFIFAFGMMFIETAVPFYAAGLALVLSISVDLATDIKNLLLMVGQSSCDMI